MSATPTFLPHEEQTLAQLNDEWAYWAEQVRTAKGLAAASAAEEALASCEAWIAKREAEIPVPQNSQFDAFTILNHVGQIWTLTVFQDREAAEAYRRAYQARFKGDLSKHTIVPCRVTITPLEQPK